MTARVLPNRTRAIVMIGALALLSASGESLHAQTTQPARVQGEVFDSIAHRPLAGAMVQLAELPPGRGVYSATTDSMGRFRMDSVHAGNYLIGFLHPLLDSIGITPPTDSISVRDGATANFALAIPSERRIARTICGGGQTDGRAARAGAGDSVGMIVGHVRDAKTGAPMPGTAVTLQWRTLIFGSGAPHTELRTLRATTMDEGWFAMCGLAVDAYQLHAEHGRQETGLLDVDIHPHEIVRLSLLLGGDTSRAPADSASRGGATIAGTVTTKDNRPLEGAQVAVDGSQQSSITDARGAFRLTGLPDGTRMAEARALGYEPVRVSVEPSRSQEQVVTIVMPKKVATLDAVTVYGKRGRRFRDLTGFLERQHRGFGHFLTQMEIDNANVTSVCELLRRVPGVQVIDAGLASCTANIRGSSAGMKLCEPTVYEDNAPFGGTLSEFSQSVSARDIMGIEVYTTATQPPQFQGSCGVIIVWTKSGV
jgi:hypothetical protein